MSDDFGPDMRLLTAYGFAMAAPGVWNDLSDEEMDALRHRVQDAGTIAGLLPADRARLREAMAVAFTSGRIGTDMSWAEEDAFLDEMDDDVVPAGGTKGVDFDEPDDEPAAGDLPAADDDGWVGV